MCPRGSVGVPEVKKSIFPLWSGFVLGCSKWPKNARKCIKNVFSAILRIFGHTVVLPDTHGCHLGTRLHYRVRSSWFDVWWSRFCGFLPVFGTARDVLVRLPLPPSPIPECKFRAFLGHLNIPEQLPTKVEKSIF